MPAGKPVIIAHCRDISDQAAPIYTTGEAVPSADGGFADMQCLACDSHLFVSPAADFTWWIVEHKAGCRVLAGLTAASR
jgi:hypothetical protein